MPLLLLLGLLAEARAAIAAEDDISFAGTYRDERIAVKLEPPVRAGDIATYKGLIQMGEQKFPLKAQAQDSRLDGTFESEGTQYQFTGSIVGQTFVFMTGGTTYRLKKQTPANPLARATSKPNPLASGPPPSNPAETTPGAVQTPPAAPATASTSPAAPATRPQVSPTSNFVLLQRRGLMDDPLMIGGEAFNLLVPAGWQLEGGVMWRIHPAVPAYVAVRVSNSNATEVLETFPAVPFVSVEGGIPFYPTGSNYMGNIVAEPIEDPGVYIRQLLLPRFRPKLSSPQIVSNEELPRVAEAISQSSQEEGVQKKFRAVRMRLEYPEGGRTMQEDIYCVLGVAYVPNIRTTFWGPDRNYAFKAEKGRLDARAPVMQAMIASFQPNLSWFNRYLQMVQLLMQNPLDPKRPISELTPYVTHTNPEISELVRQAFERQQAARDRVNTAFEQYLPGVQEFRNPFDNHKVSLPTGYPENWISAQGECLLSDDTKLSASLGASKDWQRLQRVQ